MPHASIDTKTNPGLRVLIQDLKKKSWENEAPIWRDIAKRLEKPTKQRIVVNLSRIDRYANEGDTVLVPGKLLAAGSITKKVKVAAYNFSAAAVEKIVAAGGECVSIESLAENNPQGTKVKILG
jgi:large subunit ribosomal protein L18e